jgi:hypothetical protein
LKARFTCDGYDLPIVPAVVSRNTPQLTLYHGDPKFLLSAFRATALEWQAYAFYNSKVASILGGAFDQDLWQKLVIQVAQVEPTVRHGVFALGCLFRHLDLSDNISECTCAHCSQALRQFNKSISAFRAYLQRPPMEQSIDIALLSCLIFVCIESYRMNNLNTIDLISKGCWMIAGVASSDAQSFATTLDENLLKAFDRLWLLSNMFGRHVPRPRPHPSIARIDVFDSIEAARDSLHDITTLAQSLRLRVYQAQVQSASSLETSTKIAALKQEQGPILELLENWRDRFQDLMERKGMQSFVRSKAWYGLTNRYLISKIRTAACMDPTEATDDDQVEDFQKLVTVAEEGLTRFATTAEDKRFSLESSFLPALYVTAIKCRHPTVRRKALELLCLAGVRETLWQKYELICVAARVIELEEGVSALKSEQLPPAFSRQPLRFYDVLLDLNYRQEGKSFIHVAYLVHGAPGEEPWQTAEETLTISN